MLLDEGKNALRKRKPCYNAVTPDGNDEIVYLNVSCERTFGGRAMPMICGLAERKLSALCGVVS